MNNFLEYLKRKYQNHGEKKLAFAIKEHQLNIEHHSSEILFEESHLIESEEEKATRILLQKFGQKNYTIECFKDIKMQQKCLRFLIQRGFNYAIAKKAWERFIDHFEM